MAAVLVPGRHDRDDISQWVVDRDPIGLGRVDVFVVRLAHKPGTGQLAACFEDLTGASKCLIPKRLGSP
jgi:hypothetical protein